MTDRSEPAPGFVQLMLLPGTAGATAGAVGAAALALCDVGGIGRLIRETDQGWLAFLLLLMSFMVTIGSAAIGAAIIGQGHD